ERKGLQAEIETLEGRIAENRARNTEVLRMHNEFQKEARFINELSGYLEQSLDLSAFLVALGETMPPGMTLSTMSYQDAGARGKVVVKELQLNGSIEGARDSAASVVTQYVNTFTEDPYFSTVVER